MAHTDTYFRSAKPGSKPYKLSDEGGLFLLVNPGGGKLWRLKYRYLGKEKLLSIGGYPETSLKDARKKRDEAKTLLVEGIDPGAAKKRQAVAAKIAADNTFKVIADEFLEKTEMDGLAEATRKKNRWLASQLETDLGNRPVSEIEPFEVLALLRKIERKGNHETAKRLCAFISRVFSYAIITSRARFNPAADVGKALVNPKVQHHAAILDPKGVGDLMRAIDGFEGFITTRLALLLTPHLFVRPGELRQAEWSEIDTTAKVWRIPAAKMKMRNEHVVPLSDQALAILTELREVTGDGKYLFPSIRTPLRPMSSNTINVALRRLGYTHDDMTAHGFRSTASSLLNESGKWSADAIERSLAHKDSNAIRGIYHRGIHWDERVQMMQWWSDYLDRLRDGAEVVAIKRGA